MTPTLRTGNRTAKACQIAGLPDLLGTEALPTYKPSPSYRPSCPVPKDMVKINARCVNGVDLEQFEVTKFDGRSL